jgi:hypothetical protein
MKKSRVAKIALALAGTVLLAGCYGEKIDRKTAESLLTKMSQAVKATGYALPKEYTLSATETSGHYNNAGAAYSQISHYYHYKLDYTYTDSSSSASDRTEEHWIYLKDNKVIDAYNDSYVGRYYKDLTQSGPDLETLWQNTVFAFDQRDYFFTNAATLIQTKPTDYLSDLTGFDSDAPSDLTESYHSQGTGYLKMDVAYTAAPTDVEPFAVKESVEFENNRIVDESVENGGSKSTRVFAWDMVSLLYPDLSNYTDQTSAG